MRYFKQFPFLKLVELQSISNFIKYLYSITLHSKNYYKNIRIPLNWVYYSLQKNIRRISLAITRKKYFFERRIFHFRQKLITSIESSCGFPYKHISMAFFLNVFFIILFKIIIRCTVGPIFPFYFNLFFYVLFFLLNLKFGLEIFFFLRSEYIKYLKVLLGKSYWFTDWTDSLFKGMLIELRDIIYKLRTIDINKCNSFNLFFRFLFCLSCQFELFRLSWTKSVIMCNILLHYCLIFNHLFYSSLCISIIFFISRFNLLLTDVYMADFYTNIQKLERIKRRSI